MEIGNLIRRLRRKKNLTQRQLAAKSGLSSNYICRLECGEFPNPTRETFESIASALGVGVSALLGQPSTDRRGRLKKEDEMHMVPLLTGAVSAGTFEQAFEDWDGAMIPFHGKSKDVVAWRIRGNSMKPDLEPGDIIFIHKDAPVYNQCRVIAKNGDGETVKEYWRLKDGTVELRPLNPEYPTLRFNEDNGKDLEVLGVVIGKYEDWSKEG